MSPTVYLALFGWIPIVLQIFNRFPPQRAAVISFIAGTLFLPQAGIALPVIPDFNKENAICYGILLATYLKDSQRFSRFQFGWIDIPMAIWCLCPFVTSTVNGLGLYDGFLNVLDVTMSWGVPYFIGRLYLGSLDGLRQLAIAIVLGGLAYAPFCLFESRFSPQLHRMVYGFHAHSDFAQTMRMGGFRPNVFMKHGLMLAMWMMAATLLAMWLWHTGVLKRVQKVKMVWVLLLMLLTFAMIKSTGAYLLLAFGLVILLVAKYLRTAILMLLVAALVVGYLHMGVSGTFTVENVDRVTEFASQITGEDRAGSLRFRLDNEQLLGERARQQALFGWGGWGRSRILNDQGEDVSVTDSLWIITFGTYGMVGLISQFATLLLPPVAFLVVRYPGRTWRKPEVAPAAGLAVIMVLYAYDCTLNAMFNPVFTLLSGGLAGLAMNGNTVEAGDPVQRSLPPTPPPQPETAAKLRKLVPPLRRTTLRPALAQRVAQPPTVTLVRSPIQHRPPATRQQFTPRKRITKLPKTRATR